MRSCHTRLRPRRLAALLALLAAVLGSGTAGAAPTPPPDDPALAQSVAPDEAAASGPAVIDVGHVDVGPRVVDGQWQVMARDDSGPAPVWRDPAQTVLHVTDAALMDAPTDPAYDFMGGRAGERWYVVPQTQNPDVVWLGWNTQDPGVTRTVQRGATMSIGPVSGPGRAWMFLQNGTFGKPLPLMDSQTGAPQDVWVDVNTHVHANWVFSAPGTYLSRLTFSADTLDGRHVSATTVLRFAVGSATSTQDALALDASAVLDAGAAGATPSTPATTQDASPAPGSGSRATLLVGGGVVVLVLVGGAWILLRARATARERARAQAEVRADRETGTGTGPTAEGHAGTTAGTGAEAKTGAGTAPDAGAPAGARTVPDVGARTDREVRTGTSTTTEGPTGTAQPRGGRE